METTTGKPAIRWSNYLEKKEQVSIFYVQRISGFLPGEIVRSLNFHLLRYQRHDIRPTPHLY